MNKDLCKNNNESKDQIDCIERFVSLAPGQYWKALVDDSDNDIEEGEVLLLSKIDDVDNAAHTIYVRIHPSKVRPYHSSEAKFLVDNFLNKFEHVSIDVAENIREEEIKAIQGRISDAQDDLQAACADMDLLDSLIEEEEREQAEENPDNTNLPVKYEALGADITGAIRTQKVSALMSPGLTEKGIEQIRSTMEHHKEVTVKRTDWITRNTKKLSKIAEELTPYFEEKSALALAMTSDMRKHIDDLMKGIGNLNLYVLKDVLVETLTEGKSAPKETKLAIAQSVLFMDEEMAVFHDVEDDFDFESRKHFFEALSSTPELVKQIFPSERSIVALAATQQRFDYVKKGYSPGEAEAMSRENATAFLLIRDGENIHIVLSPELFHQLTRTIFPSKDETDRIFKGFDGTTISYSDLRYTNSLKMFERIALSYKRLLILLCGLDHNKQIFGEFYDGPPSLDFVSMEFQEKYFHFIHDSDGEGLISTHRPADIDDWTKDLNSEISSGSRVLMRWRKVFTPKSIPGAFERESNYNFRHGRSLLYRPDPDDYIFGVVKKNKGNLVVEIELSGKTRDWEYRKFNGRLNMDVVLQESRLYDLICIDRLVPEDAEWYLHDRPSRVLNVPAIRLLKHAIKFAREERTKEKEVRERLLTDLLESRICEDDETASRLVDKAVATWHCANPRKELNELLTDSRRYNILCDQLFQISGVATDQTNAVIKSEEALGRTVIRVSVTANGQYCAYSTPLEAERDDRLIPFQWVARTRYKPVKDGVKALPKTFAYLKAKVGDETVKFEIENLKDYVAPKKNIFTTPKAKASILSSKSDPREKWKQLRDIANDNEAFDRIVDDYNDARIEISSGGYVTEPNVAIFVGFRVLNEYLCPIALVCTAAEVLAFLAKDDPVRRITLIREYIGRYQHQDEAHERIQEYLRNAEGTNFFDLFSLAVLDKDAEEYSFFSDLSGCSALSDAIGQKYSFDAKIERDIKERGSHIWLVEGLEGSIDKWLDITPPEDHYPCVLIRKGFGGAEGANLFEYVPEAGSYGDTRYRDITDKVFDTLDDALAEVEKGSSFGRGTDRVNYKVNITYKEIEPRKFDDESIVLKSWEAVEEVHLEE